MRDERVDILAPDAGQPTPDLDEQQAESAGGSPVSARRMAAMAAMVVRSPALRFAQ